MKTEADARPNASQVRKREDAQTPIAVLGRREADILNLEIPARERISAWSVRTAASGGLRRGDILNADPPALDLMNEGLIGLAPAGNQGGSLKVGIGGLANFVGRRKITLG